MAQKNKNPNATLPSPKNRSQYVKIVKKGQVFYKQGDYNQALKHFTRSWDYDSKNPGIIKLVAECLFQIGNRNVAINLLAFALQENPSDPVIISILGNAALKMDLFDLSQKFHQIYIQLKPEDPIGYNNYASALREDGKLDEAINFLQDILPLFPEEDILWNTLGSSVAFRDGGAAAIVFYEECLRLNPKNSLALNNITTPYMSIGEVKKAEEAARKSIALNPNLAKIHLFLSTLLFSSRRLEEGWKEYQWRKSEGNITGTIAYNKIPQWQGEDLTGKKIFIFGEQGIGDEIIFTWLYNEIIEEAEKVGLACTTRLVPLFKNSFKKAHVCEYIDRFDSKLDFDLKTFPGTDITEYDYICCAGDLARYKWLKYEDIKPSSEAILHPSEEKMAYWRERIAELPHKISVGISWRSGITHAKRARNYTSLLNWQPILKQKNINFINIQYGDCAAELEELEKETGIKIHNFEDLNLKDDFDGTTALIKNCDLFIGPGSAPLVQSMCVGVESWALLSGNPWWCFGEETPIWQQNMRAFNKTDNDPWESLLEDCGAELKKWLKTKRK
ncbi:MAG: tetratricopeptide repeat protein [Emcibacteraceae bacterium]|nr:tetratricopeptide repeat protein [Emcibacteraceae bacterium]